MKRINWKKYGRIAVYIDNGNIIHSPPKLGWYPSLQKISELFHKSPGFQAIRLFDTIPEEEDLKKLLEQKRGFTKQDYEKYLKRSEKSRYVLERAEHEWKIDINLKPLRFIWDEKKGEYQEKGDCDVDLTVEAIRKRKTYDALFLISGDGDFVALVNYLKICGKKVVVVSTRDLVANILIEAASEYIDLQKLKERIFLKPCTKKS